MRFERYVRRLAAAAALGCLGGTMDAPLVAQGPVPMNAPIESLTVSPSSESMTVGQNRFLNASALLSGGVTRILGGGGGSPLWHLSFEPMIPVSVCGTNAVAFSSQVVQIDGAGAFHAVWSLGSPNTLRADGAMTLPTGTTGATLAADLACVSGAATGALSAAWTGTHYDGAYAFNGSAGAIAVVGLTWTSSNPSVATVDSTGKVTGVAPGDAVITATYGSRCWQMTASATQCFGTSTASSTIRVNPPSTGGGGGGGGGQPIMTAGPDQTVQCTTHAGGTTTLQGAIFFTPTAPISFTWAGPFGTLSGATPTVTLPTGAHTLTFTISNGTRSISDTALVTVVDTVAPVIQAASATPATIWPANHRMVSASLAVAAADACDPHPACEIVEVSADDGATSADWRIAGPLSLDVRASRSGGGAGRTYSATVRCRDAAGNTSTTDVPISVPHDRR